MKSVRAFLLAICILIVFQWENARAGDSEPSRCQAIFVSRLMVVTNLPALGRLHDRVVEKKPGTLASKLGHPDEIPLRQSEIDALRLRLPQKERSLIFLALADHPSMLFGQMGRALRDVHGVIDPDGQPSLSHVWATARPYTMSDRLREVRNLSPRKFRELYTASSLPSHQEWLYRLGIESFANETFNLLDAVAQAHKDQASVRIYSNSHQSEIEIPLGPIDYSAKIASHGRNGLATSAFKQAAAHPLRVNLSEFRSFFKWLHEKPERLAYAKLVIASSGDAIFEFFSSLDKKIGEQVERDFTGDISAALLVPNEKPGVLSRLPVTSRRRLLNSIRNTKREIGVRLYAFAELGHTEIETPYEVVGWQMRVKYGAKLKAVAHGPFALDPSEFIESARAKRQVLTAMSADLTLLHERVLAIHERAVESLAAEHIFSQGSKAIERTAIEIDELTDLATVMENDVNDVIAFTHEAQADLGFTRQELAKMDSTAPELETIDTFLNANKKAFSERLHESMKLVKDVWQRIDSTQLAIMNSISQKP